MSDRIYEGYFFMANHFGDNKEILRHPFLAIGISKNKVVALQFSSSKYENDFDSESHFSAKEEIKYKQIPTNIMFGTFNQTKSFSNIVDADINHGLKYHSQANIDLLHVFDFNNQEFYAFKLLEECEDEKWKEIIRKLQTNVWNDNFRNKMVQQWQIR